MTKPNEILRVEFDDHAMQELRKSAELTAFGGKSDVRDVDDRARTCYQDQLTGLMGLRAVSRLLFGRDTEYKIARFYADIYRYNGDGGIDLPGTRIDVRSKRRKMRVALCEHVLPVQPNEKHDNTTYILTLADTPRHICYAMGWAVTSMLPLHVDRTGAHKGAHTLLVRDLNPLMPCWWWERRNDDRDLRLQARASGLVLAH